MHRAEGIGNPAHGEHFGALVEQRVKCLLIEHARFITGNHAQDCSTALAGHLPWHDVRVVLQCSDQNFITSLQGGAKSECREIDRIRSSRGEDDFRGIAATDVPCYGLTRVLMALCRRTGELVRSTMNVGINRLVVLA